jgi:hypothetical protein
MSNLGSKVGYKYHHKLCIVFYVISFAKDMLSDQSNYMHISKCFKLNCVYHNTIAISMPMYFAMSTLL